jgi:hypothetical protein
MSDQAPAVRPAVHQSVEISRQLDAALAAWKSGLFDETEYEARAQPLRQRLLAVAAAEAELFVINTPAVVAGELIESAWGNTVRSDLLNLDATKAGPSAAFSITTQGIPTATPTPVLWSAGLLNTGWRDGTDLSVIRPPTAGTYFVSASIAWVTGAGGMPPGTRIAVDIRVNGVSIRRQEQNSSTYAAIEVNGPVTVATGQYVQVFAYQEHTATHGLAIFTSLAIARLG